jgi:hypothetical protein
VAVDDESAADVADLIMELKAQTDRGEFGTIQQMLEKFQSPLPRSPHQVRCITHLNIPFLTLIRLLIFVRSLNPLRRLLERRGRFGLLLNMFCFISRSLW